MKIFIQYNGKAKRLDQDVIPKENEFFWIDNKAYKVIRVLYHCNYSESADSVILERVNVILEPEL